MTSSELTGRRIALTVGIGAIVMSQGQLAYSAFLSISGAINLTDIVRLCLAVALAYFLYSGAPTARWIAIIFFAVGGALALYYGVGVYTRAGFRTVIIDVIGVLYIVFAAALLFPASVRAYFRRRALNAV